MKLLFIMLILTIPIISYGRTESIKNGVGNNATIDTDGMAFKSISIQLGTKCPVGSLARVFDPSPYLSIRTPFYYEESLGSMTLFELGASYALSFNPKEIQLAYDNERVKALGIGDVGMWYRYKKKIKKDVFVNRYVGMGWNYIATDKKDTYGDQYDTYTSRTLINAFFINTGIDVQYKRFGILVEMNNAFYNWWKESKKSLGGLSLNIGLYIKL